MHYVDFYSLYVGCHSRFMGCIATIWADTTSMWVIKASAHDATTSNSNPDRQNPDATTGKQDMELRQGIKTANQDSESRLRTKTKNQD